MLDDDGDVLAARPLALDEQRPQVRVVRRTVEQIGDVVPLVPALADSVPQMVGQLVAVLAHCDMPLADQVIEVPKVSCPFTPLCSYCSPYAADGGTAGESADDPLLSQAAPSTLMVDLKVPKVFSQDRVLPIQCRAEHGHSSSRSWCSEWSSWFFPRTEFNSAYYGAER